MIDWKDSSPKQPVMLNCAYSFTQAKYLNHNLLAKYPFAAQFGIDL